MSAYTTEILDMKLGGMVCPSCEDVIAAALLAERGVADAEVSYYKSAARVKYDPAIVTPERLEQVRKGIRNRKARETDIYGLYNVNERIRLNFGENYGITITSTYGEGTCVTVRLPQH